MKRIKLLAVAFSLILANNVTAATIWDEGVNGDLNNSGDGTDIGTIESGAWDIIGTLDGVDDSSTRDEYDVFHFTAGSAWNFSLTDLNLDTASGFFVWLYSYDGVSYNYLNSFNSSASGTLTTDQMAGSYKMNFAPIGNIGALAYQAQIEVSAVPLPAALWLFGPALLGFIGFRRKAVNVEAV